MDEDRWEWLRQRWETLPDQAEVVRTIPVEVPEFSFDPEARHLRNLRRRFPGRSYFEVIKELDAELSLGLFLGG